MGTFTTRRVLVAVAGAAFFAAACTGGTEAPTTTSVTPTTVAPTPSAPPATEPAPSTTAPAETTTVPVEELPLVWEEVLSGFAQPVFIAGYPAGDGVDVSADAVVVVDQPGRLWLVDGDDPEVFLDLRDEVRFGGEQGLLGLAFAPGFPTDPRLFVNYIDRAGSTRIVEFRIAEGGRTVRAETARTVLEIDQPASNHNGGMIAFGPDGYLWIGMGDGGAADDRFGNGQDPTTLLGAMLRIDVSGTAPAPYGIPPDNPYADGVDGAPEVFATGLRNPWRWSFDGSDLWIADVGQNEVEEVDVLRDAPSRGGANLGWPVWEGDRCFAGPCDDPSAFVFPVVTYGHDEGCSITGGFVYRGSEIPELNGHYLFADFCSGIVRSVAPDGAVHDWTERAGRIEGVTSFGVDNDGELYVTLIDGRIWRLRRG